VHLQNPSPNVTSKLVVITICGRETTSEVDFRRVMHAQVLINVLLKR
jgi:hypothetical protein